MGRSFMKVIATLGMLSSIALAGPYGVNVGLGYSTTTGDDADDTEGGFSYSVGGFGKIPINEQLFVNAGVAWASRSFSVDYSETDLGTVYSTSRDYTFHYLDISALAGYQIAPQITLLAGPVFSFFVNGTYDITSTDEDGTYSSDGDLERGDVSSLPISLALGGEYAINEQISVGARYAYGLTSVIGEDDADIAFSTIQLMAAYSF